MSQPIFTMTGHEVFVNKDTGTKISIHVEVKGRHLNELWSQASKLAERQIRAVFGDEMLDQGVLQTAGDGVIDQDFYSPSFELINRFEDLTPEQKAAAVARQACLPESEREAEQLYGSSIAAPAAKLLARLRWRLPELDERSAIWAEIHAADDSLKKAAKQHRAKEVTLHTINPFEAREKEQERLSRLRDEITLGVSALDRARELMLKEVDA